METKENADTDTEFIPPINPADSEVEKELIKEAHALGFLKGVSYEMMGKKYTINGDLFLRKMYKFGMGTSDDAFDFYVINHKGGDGCIYVGKTKQWPKIIES